MPFSTRFTLRPELLAISVALDDQGETVPGRGITEFITPGGVADNTGGPPSRPLQDLLIGGGEALLTLHEVHVLRRYAPDGRVGKLLLGAAVLRSKPRKGR